MKQLLPAFLSRREFLQWSAGALGTAGLLTPSMLRPPPTRAFPPDQFFDGVVRMVFHENPWGPHPAAVEAIREVMGKSLSGGGVNRYGDFLENDLKEAILRYNGLDRTLTTENVILGVGSSEILFIAADAFTSPMRPLLSEWPTYRIILLRALQNRAEVAKVPLLADWRPDLDVMCQRAGEAGNKGQPFGLVHFNVINNPCGTFLQQKSFDDFARKLYACSPESIILCDDSDREFMETRRQTQMFLAARHVMEGRNMLHVQTFSHTFGLTGLRLGYGIAPTNIINAMEGHRIFSGVNVLGRAAALASLAHAEEQIRRVNPLCTESRNHLYRELDTLGLEYLPSQGHYILVNLGNYDGTLAVLLMYLFQKVFVRWGSEWEMANWIRVNPGTEWENQRFLQALEWLLGQRQFRRIGAGDYLSSTAGRRLAAAAVQAGFPASVLQEARAAPSPHGYA